MIYVLLFCLFNNMSDKIYEKIILITGITGFLGRHLVKYLCDKNIKIIGIANSQYKISRFNKEYNSIFVKCMNITSKDFKDELDILFIAHKPTHVIHTAGLKYIDIAEKNIMTTIETNIIATNYLLQICKRYNVANLIAISTDKANDPKNIYGMSKYIMQQLVLNYGYSVYQGVNFFWSDGSVFDIWYKQLNENKPLTVIDENVTRYFNLIDDVCYYIYKNINVKNSVILPENVYNISMSSCHLAFCKFFNYKNISFIKINDFEKQHETIDGNINVIDVDETTLFNIISRFKEFIWLQ